MWKRMLKDGLLIMLAIHFITMHWAPIRYQALRGAGNRNASKHTGPTKVYKWQHRARALNGVRVGEWVLVQIVMGARTYSRTISLWTKGEKKKKQSLDRVNCQFFSWFLLGFFIWKIYCQPAFLTDKMLTINQIVGMPLVDISHCPVSLRNILVKTILKPW